MNCVLPVIEGDMGTIQYRNGDAVKMTTCKDCLLMLVLLITIATFLMVFNIKSAPAAAQVPADVQPKQVQIQPLLSYKVSNRFNQSGFFTTP